ncbi:MAG: hypothetical protein ABFD97_18085 [Syntrophobacter sp.]
MASENSRERGEKRRHLPEPLLEEKMGALSHLLLAPFHDGGKPAEKMGRAPS